MTMPIFSAFRKKDWREYHKILYSSRSSLFRDTPKYLFIIGGEDVVPMPELIADRKFEIPDKVIPTDYVYAFDVVPPQNALEAIRRRWKLPWESDADLAKRLCMSHWGQDTLWHRGYHKGNPDPIGTPNATRKEMYKLKKEVNYDKERNPKVDRAAYSEHRHSNSHSPRSNILLRFLDKEGSKSTAFFYTPTKSIGFLFITSG